MIGLDPTTITFPPSQGPVMPPTDSPVAENDGIISTTENGDGATVDGGNEMDVGLVLGVAIVVIVLCYCCLVIVLCLLNKRNKDREDEQDKAFETTLSKPMSVERVHTQDERSESDEDDDEKAGVDDTEMTDLKQKRKRMVKPKRKKRKESV